MSESSAHGLLELPCLGRPFQLGMLYDCRNDGLIPGVTLWGPDTLGNVISKPMESSDFEIITEDSFNQKTLHLDISAGLKLSVLGGLVKAGGSGKFLYDRTTSKNQARVSLRYKSTSKFEQLTMSHLGKFDYPRVFEDDIATHVVTGVQYGADAVFVFDRQVDSTEKFYQVHGKLEAMISVLPSIDLQVGGSADLYLQNKGNEGKEKIQCKFYGDFILPKNPTTYQDAVRVYQELPKLLGGAGCPNSVPKKVWLYPLSKLDSRVQRMVRDISSYLIDDLQEVMESLHEQEVRINDLVKSEVCSCFEDIKADLEKLRRFIGAYKVTVMKTLSTLLPKVRGGGEEETKLAELLEMNYKSPFSCEKVSSWVKMREKEVAILTVYLTELRKYKIQFAFGADEMVSLTSGLPEDTVLCFDFNIPAGKDAQLQRMENYLHGRRVEQDLQLPSFWYNSQELRQQLQRFVSFVTHNCKDSTCKYVVTNGYDSVSSKLGVMRVFIDACPTEFEPPDQPGVPRASSKTLNNLKLSWGKPKYGSESVQSYTVSYHSDDGPPDQWSTQTSSEECLVLTKLTPGSLYHFKVTAESAVGSSPESKVLIERIPPDQPGRPQVIEKSHNSIQLKWGKPKHGAHIVQSYSVHYHLANGPWCIQTSIEESSILTKLTPGSLYYFKITAESAVGSSPVSEINLVTLPPGEPGKPFSTQVTPNAIKVQWAKPKHGAESVKYYIVSYRSLDDQSDQWSSQSTNEAQEYAWLTNLVPNRSYIVKAQAVNFNNENGPESEPNDNPINTFLSPPGKPRAVSITHNSVQLSWEKPEHGAESVQMYTVSYHSINDEWQICMYSTRNCSVLIQGLYSKMPYIFKVRAETNLGPSPYSESSDPIEMVLLPSSSKPDIPYIAEASLSTLETIPGEFCTSQATYTELSQSQSPDFVVPAIKTTVSKKKPWGAKFPFQNKRIEEATSYQLPLYYTTSKKNSYVKAVVGALPVQSKVEWSLPVPHKVLMLVGATGSGKTSLINAMVNYIMGVDWEDEYRFKLISDETAHDQTKSQITAYTFRKDRRSPLPYTLTVIDTPEFGDTGGDKQILYQIEELFSIRGDEGIDQLHGIGFVTQAPLAQLTPTQQYIYDSILSVFGKDVVDNIFLLVTFADGKRPPVLDAARSAGFPFSSYFMFNSSAFFASNQTKDKFESFWRMSENSFKNFFNYFSRAQAQSLKQSRVVLQERENLEVRMQGLQPLIRAGLAKICELQQEKRLIQVHKSEIIANKSFTYKVQVVCRKFSLSEGRYTTNCLKCNFTCHENCPHSCDGNTFKCSAMNDPGSLDSTCAVCPGRCSWKDHDWNPYKFEIYVALETRTSVDLGSKYMSTLANKSQVEEVIMRIDSELNEVTLSVFQVIKQAHQIMEHLLMLALKPHDLTVVDYIDLLIESEKHEGLQSELVAVLHEIRKQSIEQMRPISEDSFLHSKDVLEDPSVVFHMSRQLPGPDMRENKNLMKLWPTVTKSSTLLDEQISLPVSSTHFGWKKSENVRSTVAKVIYF